MNFNQIMLRCACDVFDPRYAAIQVHSTKDTIEDV